ncbi:hypothetical protein [Gluconacetobacter sp.]|uniref:hypothetical protein n=1 Tax=Gluconacetobacter sp. TaxID=1935994 RepID=UPI0039EC0EDC
MVKKKNPGTPPVALAASQSDRLFHEMKMEAARALAMDPQNVRALAQAIASTPAKSDPDDELCDLLTMTLDQARMAQENGQRFGGECLDAVSRHLATLSGTPGLTLGGNIAITRCYVRAGLPVPEELAPDDQALMEEAATLSIGDDAHPETAFAALLHDALATVGDDPSMLQQAFAEILPGIPAAARRMLCRLAAANPDRRLEPLACAWLLDPSESVRNGAIDGLGDRLAAGILSAQALSRLVVLRTWIVHKSARRRLDTLVRNAIRSDISPDQAAVSPYRIVGYVSSPVDGAGAQSLGVALQKGRARSIALVLLKQQFGIKDAYIAPCASAADQRSILQQIAGPGQKGDISPEYLQVVLGIALADGLHNGAYPAPGLVDVVDACAITALRPEHDASIQAMLDRYDPEGDLASLDAKECETLIAASADWAALHPVIASWFEDRDDMFDGAESSEAQAQALWKHIETQRNFWASIIARMALLLKDRQDPLALSFAVTARALIHGRPLQKIPIMFTIFDQTFEARLMGHSTMDDEMPEEAAEELMTLMMNLMSPPKKTPKRSSRGTPPRKATPRKPK